MNNPLVSVIVPVYNVERYLPRCIESILRQTYTNFEFILVDDGTPDRSGIICDRYAEKDSRIKVIHKENGGVSSARNTGIDAAQGEWITFVDSDDWVTDDYLKTLLENVLEKHSDLCVGSIQWNNYRTISRPLDNVIIEIGKTQEEYITKIINCQEFWGPVTKLFKSAIIKDNNITFPSNISLGEDTIFTNRYLSYCKKISTVDTVIYMYNKFNENSLTRTYARHSNVIEAMQIYFNSYMNVWNQYQISDNCKNRSMVELVYDAYVYHIGKYIKLDFSEKEFSEINNFFSGWLKLDKKLFVANDKKRALVDAIINDDQRKIIELIAINRITPKKHTIAFKNKLKRTVKKILKPFLEKYRDGLIKFKF